MTLTQLTGALALLLAMQCFAQHEESLHDFLRAEWDKFKVEFRRDFDDPLEAAHRFAVFGENLRRIREHNEAFRRGEHSFDVRINLFGDMTAAEIRHQRNGFNASQQRSVENILLPFGLSQPTLPFGLHRPDLPLHLNRFRLRRSAANKASVPEAIDWRAIGAVGPVLDQAECGACWAFSAAGALEAMHFRHSGRLESVAVQQLIDCARDNGNRGCDGGVMEEAFDYVRRNGGIGSADRYPFVAVQNEVCTASEGPVILTGAGFKRIATNNERKLMEAVANVGPIAVAIDASEPTFQFYEKGVYYEPKCTVGLMNHGVLVVGYGTDAETGADYWLVKNSWGESWGENGYVRIARNRDNNCCIACYGAYPVMSK